MARQEKNAAGLFLRELVLRPKQLGAIAPSSRRLACAMARWLPDNPGAFVLELGPGTGVVTQALLDKGLPPRQLVAVEKSPSMADHLRECFPEATVIIGDAVDLPALLEKHAPRALPFPVVISSLPLLNFERDCAERIALNVRNILAPRGRMVQFSYHILSSNSKLMKAFRLIHSHLVWLNLPPARVSVYEK